MKLDVAVKATLALIVLFLGVIALRPVIYPSPVAAQTAHDHNFYVEPGTTMLRKPDGTMQVYGKVFIDMNTGDVWGFPTQHHRSLSLESGKFDSAQVVSAVSRTVHAERGGAEIGTRATGSGDNLSRA